MAPGSPAAAVWASMQAASAQSHVMATYLPDTPPQSARVLLNSLAERRCAVILTRAFRRHRSWLPPGPTRGQQFMLITDSPHSAASERGGRALSRRPVRAGSTVRGLASAA